MPSILRHSHHENLRISFLTDVRQWSLAFFEAAGTCDERRVQPKQQTAVELMSEKAKQASFALKLVDDLLTRGHGDLAGRTARKAFLLVEDLLKLEGPVVIWNVLEIMYDMLAQHHEQLFRILLAHLIELLSGNAMRSQPLLAMLRVLQRLITSATLAEPPDYSSRTSSTSSSPSGSTGDGSTVNLAHSSPDSYTILRLLEEAWILNAEIALRRFNPDFVHIYCQLHWESCSLALPAAIIDAVNKWLKHIQMQQASDSPTAGIPAAGLATHSPAEEHRMLQRLFAPRNDASPSLDYDTLRASSIAALKSRTSCTIDKKPMLDSDSAALLQVLPALVKASVAERPGGIVNQSTIAISEAATVPRSLAGNVASVIRALIDLDLKANRDNLTAHPDLIERMRLVVALREYAYSETDPQVIRDMWLLADTLAAAGETGKAKEVIAGIMHRLNKYTRDISFDTP
jgi:hypothetical protein